ncbi:MAG: hypothetical protein WA821_18125, partial [Anaerolineales bacterium]
LQQEVIRLLIDHVVVGKNEIVIKHIVPTDDDCRLKPQRQVTKPPRVLAFSFKTSCLCAFVLKRICVNPQHPPNPRSLFAM